MVISGVTTSATGGLERPSIEGSNTLRFILKRSFSTPRLGIEVDPQKGPIMGPHQCR